MAFKLLPPLPHLGGILEVLYESVNYMHKKQAAFFTHTLQSQMVHVLDHQACELTTYDPPICCRGSNLSYFALAFALRTLIHSANTYACMLLHVDPLCS
jgi:hypothetical protein